MPTAPRSKHRLLACALLALAAMLAIPSAASAGKGQLSLFQDDRELTQGQGASPSAVLNQFDALGVDILRTNVIYGKVYRTPGDHKKPSDFTTEDNANPHYDWSATDNVVNLAKARGIRIQLTITGPVPVFASDHPSKCKGGGSCTYAPSTKEFSRFVQAVVKRYKGRADYYSIWNEPNIGKSWLTPRYASAKGVGRYDYAAAKYRKLYVTGQKTIARYDPSHRNRVLFGEVPSIATPLSFIRASLCLDSGGNSFRGARARAQGCSGHVGRISTLGMAVHPYNQGALFGPQQRYKTPTSMTIAQLPRLHRLLDGAYRHKRISSGARNVYVTEFGFQSKPPDKSFGAASLANQARYINEADRLFYGDPRVKWVSQYEFTDDPDVSAFNTGLRLFSGALKPSYGAYRMPIVVTRRSANSVEVWGQVRPGTSSTVAIQSEASGSGFTTVKSVRTNSHGFIRLNVSKKSAFRLKWRLSGVNPETGTPITSREAVAGKKLVFFKN
jgi:hypothetical protein